MIQVFSGYSGGQVDNPSYEQVCTGSTGHAEVVEVEFDPSKTNLQNILTHYFSLHDPTQEGGQGLDKGSQYRSCIYFSHSEHESIISEVLKQQQGNYQKPITTEIKSNQTFWKAEDYHQRYIEKRQLHP